MSSQTLDSNDLIFCHENELINKLKIGVNPPDHILISKSSLDLSKFVLNESGTLGFSGKLRVELGFDELDVSHESYADQYSFDRTFLKYDIYVSFSLKLNQNFIDIYSLYTHHQPNTLIVSKSLNEILQDGVKISIFGSNKISDFQYSEKKLFSTISFNENINSKIKLFLAESIFSYYSDPLYFIFNKSNKPISQDYPMLNDANFKKIKILIVDHFYFNKDDYAVLKMHKTMDLIYKLVLEIMDSNSIKEINLKDFENLFVFSNLIFTIWAIKGSEISKSVDTSELELHIRDNGFLVGLSTAVFKSIADFDSDQEVLISKKVRTVERVSKFILQLIRFK